MGVTVTLCNWSEISFIPVQFDTEYATFVDRKKKEIWFSAKSDGVLAGVGCLLKLSSNRVRHSNLFVLPDFRGKGIAQEIIKAREVYAAWRGYKWIDVRTVKLYYLEHGYTIRQEYKVGGWWFEKELK